MMMNIPAPLLTDFYKVVHQDQYDEGITKIVSYMTPRSTRIEGFDEVVCFGLQGFIQEYLIEYWNNNFFARDKFEVMQEYNEILCKSLGVGTYTTKRVEALHDLGFLPLEIKAIPEGTLVPVKVPVFEISNTHPDFAWLVNAIETALSATMWHTMISATIGHMYRNIANYYYDKTVVNGSPAKAMSDFSFRGQESIESATKASAAFLMSFLNTATIPAIAYLNEYYNGFGVDDLAYGLPSTEHSVMCSSAAIDGDEETFIKRLLTDVYPNNSFTAVCDSYDYWNVLTKILPKCKKEIKKHKGFFGVRGDSGDPVDILCGTKLKTKGNKKTPEERGTVEILWDIFGGTINSKGYKELNPCVKAVYGDSITMNRARQIYKKLEEKGFASNCVSLGVGSFSFQAIESPSEYYTTLYSQYGGMHHRPIFVSRFNDFENDIGYIDNIKENIVAKHSSLDIKNTTLYPITRDTLSFAIKCTYVEHNGKPIHVQKDPKTDSGNFKKSQKGCCVVFDTHQHGVLSDDGYDFEDLECVSNNMLQTVFVNGEFERRLDVDEIRANLNKGNFMGSETNERK